MGITEKIKLVFQDRILRKRVLFTLVILVVFRLLAIIPIPSVDSLRLEQFLSGNDFFGLLNIFSGGGLKSVSIVMLGVGPYITASIIMQLLTIMIPKLKEMYQEDGEAGRMKFSQYSRLLTVPLAMIQGFALISVLKSQGVITDLTPFAMISNLFIITVSSLLLMWLGELITEFGVGNGISLLIFAGIVASLPESINKLIISFEPSQFPAYIAFTLASILVVWGVVVITEAERPIPVTYAKQVRGTKVYGGTSTYLPLRVNQSGVMPIIFAVSIILFPQMIAKFLVGVANPTIQSMANFVLGLLSNQTFYASAYFVLVFMFTYFYTAVTFDPESISKNLQRSGAFVPGVRPGVHTADYISKVLFRITLVGALFLGLIAVLPIIVQYATGISSVAIGGTSLLIVVAVVIDMIKKVDAQLSAREY